MHRRSLPAGAAQPIRPKVADYIRGHNFNTVMRDIKFGKDGELAQSRSIFVQYQHLKGHDLGQFKDGRQPVILWPAKYQDGTVIYLYDRART